MGGGVELLDESLGETLPAILSDSRVVVDALFGTVIIERVTDMLMLMGIMIILLFSWMDKFGAFFRNQVLQPLQEKFTQMFGGTWVFWLMVGGAFLLVILLVYLFRKSLSRFVLVQRLKKILNGILDGLKTIFRMKRKWEFVLHSLLIWFLYILMTWVVVFAIKELSGLTFIDGMFLLVIGGLGMSAPVTAGFGAYHWITSRGLMLVYGFSLETGTAYAILAHESNSLLTILLGAISYLVLTLYRRKNTTDENKT